MREILFRGKSIITGEWFYGYYIQGFTGISYIFVLYDHILNMVDKYEVDPETVGQDTGLKDKNGVKIFEGDVVRCCGGEYYQGIYEFYEDVEVKFETYALSCLHGVDLLEIIGNIHDNPEVME